MQAKRAAGSVRTKVKKRDKHFIIDSMKRRLGGQLCNYAEFSYGVERRGERFVKCSDIRTNGRPAYEQGGHTDTIGYAATGAASPGSSPTKRFQLSASS